MHQSQTTIAVILIYLLAVTNVCLGFSSIIPSDKPSRKLPKPEFMTLYNNFVGYSKDANNPSIGQALSDTLANKALALHSYLQSTQIFISMAPMEKNYYSKPFEQIPILVFLS